jgi:hypothetical protein
MFSRTDGARIGDCGSKTDCQSKPIERRIPTMPAIVFECTHANVTANLEIYAAILAP